MTKCLLYIHGMGGGSDSRIPHTLRQLFPPQELRVVIRTYDFDPERGREQIRQWVEEVHPDLVVGESLGAVQALRIKGVPHLFVSPSLGGAEQLYRWAPITLFALGRWYLHHRFPVKAGDRQELKFRYRVLRKYKAHWEAAKAAIDPGGYYFAFFGKEDHYKRTGVVSVERWVELFGSQTFAEYPGTHFMEEEFIESLLVPKIREILALEK